MSVAVEVSVAVVCLPEESVPAPLASPKRAATWLAAAVLAALIVPAASASSGTALYAGPIADAACATGALPESMQGRVSSAEVASGPSLN